MSEIKLEPSWLNVLKQEFEHPRMQNLRAFLVEEIRAGKQIFPEPKNYFAALNQTPFNKVKVVILGQDPYHGPGQAHGLSFSVKAGVRLPPSLQNIFKELKSDLGIQPPSNGDLTPWAQQGVLLLNAVLTVEAGKPASHQKQGWEPFTDKIIHSLNEQCENLVFILWGSHAQKKASIVDRRRHFVLESVHPSPLSAHRGFLGSKPFSKTNEYLMKVGKTPIQWDLGLTQASLTGHELSR